MNEYFDKYLPQAAKLGKQLRERGGKERLRWMTQSYVVRKRAALVALSFTHAMRSDASFATLTLSPCNFRTRSRSTLIVLKATASTVRPRMNLTPSKRRWQTETLRESTVYLWGKRAMEA